ncbi:ATP-dependent DNA helicase PIF1-like protein [Tanacetum coccineum]
MIGTLKFETWHLLAQDVEYKRRQILHIPDLRLSDEEKKNVALFYIEELMRARGISLRRFPEMPYPDSRYISEFGNRLIYDELDYNPSELQAEYVRLHNTLTTEQRGVYDTIMNSVETKTGGVYFVYGYGGTGKTFLWKTLAAAIRRKGDIVLNVASSGIASLLMSGALLKKCKLIIWDEAPMTNKLCFEALDRSLRDILRTSRHDMCETPFGNMTVVFGGDFRQVLPVIPKGSRQDIVGASLKQSYLWDHCKVLKLTANMRLTVGSRPEDVNEIREFAEWILKVGDRVLGEANDGEVEIDIPEEIQINEADDPVASIIDFTYPNILSHINDPTYFQEKAILAPTNEVVDTINEHLLNSFPSEEMVYLSCDSIDKSENGANIDQSVFSPEFINGLKFSGIPNHKLVLKVGVPIMLLRNIDQSNGLCNGTRLQVVRLERTSIQAQIINGTHFGKTVIIPRLKISPSDKRLPLKIVRKQYPVSVSFAMTINKSQGQSLSRVGLYLPRPVFTHGQLYVAVSRVKSKRGLKVVICDQDGVHGINMAYSIPHILCLFKTTQQVVSTGAFIAMATLDELRLLIKEQVAANQKQTEVFQEQMLALQTELQATKSLIQIGRSGGGGELALRLPRSMRLDVPKFSGNDPDSWIFSITEYFSLMATPTDQRLRIVWFNLEGNTAEWFLWMTRNNLITTWEDFVKRVQNRFGPCKYDDLQGALSKLLQTGTVVQYQSEFEKLMNRVTDISENLLIAFYVSGLKPNLQCELLVAKPTSLGDAFSLARVTEARLEDQGTIVSTAKVTTVPKPTTTRFVSPRLENPKSPLLPTPPKGGVATRATPLPIKWISPAERHERLNADDGDHIEHEDAMESGDISILNSLVGHGSPCSLQLWGVLGSGKVYVLIDNGSTYNFVQPGVVERMQLSITGTKPFKVYIGSGETLLCENMCARVPIDIQGLRVDVDLFVLPMKGPDIVLGIQWLQKLGKVTHDYSMQTMEFTWLDRVYALKWDDSLCMKRISLHHMHALLESEDIYGVYELYNLDYNSGGKDTTVEAPALVHLEIEQLLEEFETIFQVPSTLPPHWCIDHRIQLFPNTKPVNVRPYRYPHYQKGEMEKLVNEMLSQGTIRISHSPFSSPVLLVKKKDGSYRFCVDYRALNEVTVKDKFPIPTADEMFDELGGAVIFTKLDLRAGYHQIRVYDRDDHEFYVKKTKCVFGAATLEYLGHIISNRGVEWGGPEDAAFYALKDRLTHAPILCLPDFEDTLVIEADASIVGIGVVLLQNGRLLGYFSRKLGPRMRVAATYQRNSLLLSKPCISGANTWWGDGFLADLKHENATLDELCQIHRRMDQGETLDGFHREHGLLLFRQRYFLGVESKLKEGLLAEFHSTPSAGHEGVKKMLVGLATLFYWKGMRRSIEEFIKKCLVCQQTKYSTHASSGLLQPLSIPIAVWEDASMTVITDCRFQGKTVIRVVTIVSDRDPIFVSTFWKQSFKASGTQSNRSTTYHPQTDGQTEVVNHGLEQYLRAMVLDRPQQRVCLLFWAEFSYNTSYHSSIKMTPFQALYGRVPPSIVPYPPGSSKVAAIDELLVERNVLLRQLKENLFDARNRMEMQANRSRREVEFNVGDKVLVKLQLYRQITLARRLSNKLAKRYYGLFEILERVGKVAYRLDLSPTSKIHPVFHVSLLKPFIGKGIDGVPNLPEEDHEGQPVD